MGSMPDGHAKLSKLMRWLDSTPTPSSMQSVAAGKGIWKSNDSEPGRGRESGGRSQHEIDTLAGCPPVACMPLG
jgi:hypothetical protein